MRKQNEEDYGQTHMQFLIQLSTLPKEYKAGLILIGSNSFLRNSQSNQHVRRVAKIRYDVI